MTAAWISGETATSFDVNIQLSKWAHDGAGTGAAFTIQFTHQGVQFGVVALYQGPSMGWYFANGYVDVENGELANATDAPGTFTPGTPALLVITFDKGHFPHGDAADNQLVDFTGGSADFKTLMPLFIAEGVSGQGSPAYPDYLPCDEVAGTIAYTFQTGGHAAHGGGATGGNATMADAGNATSTPVDSVSPAAAPATGDKNESPGAGPFALVLAACVALAVRRRRAK